MKTPLISHASAKKTRELGTLNFAFLLFSFSVCATIFFVKERRSDSEIPVGTNLEWKALLQTYFRIGTLPKIMRLGTEYRGQDNPASHFEECPKARNCRDVCLDRIKAQQAASSSSEPAAKMPQDKKCLHIEDHVEDPFKGTSECWVTKLMRCWIPDGGVQVFDGENEWDLIYHFLPSSIKMQQYFRTNMAWIHLRSQQKKMDFFIFGWGVTRTISNVCSELQASSSYLDRNVMGQIATVPPDHDLVLSGHSEGSAWAICTNLAILRRKLQIERRVIATGALVADDIIFEEYTALSPPEQNLFLLSADLIASRPEPVIIPDLYTVKLHTEKKGRTFPQFGFVCSFQGVSSRTGHYDSRGYLAIKEVRCLDPQPMIRIEEALQYINQHNLVASGTLQTIHSLKTYQECFRACVPYFNRLKWDMSPNIESYDLDPVRAEKPRPLLGFSKARSWPGSLDELADQDTKPLSDLSALLRKKMVLKVRMDNIPGGGTAAAATRAPAEAPH